LEGELKKWKWREEGDLSSRGTIVSAYRRVKEIIVGCAEREIGVVEGERWTAR
jgi:hypothetical protein